MFTYVIKLPSEIASAFLWSPINDVRKLQQQGAQCPLHRRSTGGSDAAPLRRRDITAGTCSPALFLLPSNEPFQSGALIRLRCSTLHLHTHMLLAREAAARRRLAVFGAGWQQALSING